VCRNSRPADQLTHLITCIAANVRVTTLHYSRRTHPGAHRCPVLACLTRVEGHGQELYLLQMCEVAPPPNFGDLCTPQAHICTYMASASSSWLTCIHASIHACISPIPFRGGEEHYLLPSNFVRKWVCAWAFPNEIWILPNNFALVNQVPGMYIYALFINQVVHA
jgi:hypothetical protein